MANPVLTRQFGKPDADASVETAHAPIVTAPGDRMTMGDTMRATGTLFTLLLAGAVFGWINAESISRILLISMIALFALLIATMMKPQWVRVTGPLFAVAEGVMVGAISSLYSTLFDGIVIQAILATLAVFTAMLFLYATRIIKVTERLRSMVILATVGIGIFYVATIVLSLFGVNIPSVFDTGPLGIGISLLIVGVASFNLLLDFDIIERGINEGAPGWMSWFAAFGLMVTIVWLYLELLRLIALISGRD